MKSSSQSQSSHIQSALVITACTAVTTTVVAISVWGLVGITIGIASLF